MPFTRRQMIQLSLSAAAVAALPGCGIGSDPESSTRARSEVERCALVRSGLPRTSSPTHATIPNDSDYLRMQLVYDALTVPTTGESNVAGRLASSWESDADLREWHLTLAEERSSTMGRR